MALKQMKGRKAPGLDGLQVCFLHKFWDILGQLIANMVLGILNNGDDVSCLNDTNIVLITKIKNPLPNKRFLSYQVLQRFI